MDLVLFSSFDLHTFSEFCIMIIYICVMGKYFYIKNKNLTSE